MALNEEKEKTCLKLVKSRLGITQNVRDEYITDIIRGVISDLENRNGIVIDGDDFGHLMFVCDYSEYRYSNVGISAIPRHLEMRLHDLIYG